LTAGYGEHIVLEDVSFEVYPGEVFAILGPSGCGKSTLLKHMIGLAEPEHGRVWVDGHDLVTADERTRRALLQRIGVTFQGGALFGSMTLAENVRLVLEEHTRLPKQAASLIALMKLELVGLRDYAHYLPSELSGGMQKRGAIARAMALDPPILMLDEPSAGLDPITSAELDALILQLARSLHVTFVIVTHELPSVYAVADRVIMLDCHARGIVASGPPLALRDDPSNPIAWNFFHRQIGDHPMPRTGAPAEVTPPPAGSPPADPPTTDSSPPENA